MKLLFPILFISFVMLTALMAFVWADSEIDYSASVSGTSNVIITTLSSSFAACIPGNNCTTISDSLNIRNTGNEDPTTGINASFMTNVTASTYGLNVSTNYIAGGNFTLNATHLKSTNNSVEIIVNSSIPSSSDFNISATLYIPSGQAAGTYKGVVLLSWTV